MAAAVLVSRANLAWVVGALASAEAVLEALSAALDGRVDHFFLWLAGAVVILPFALSVESLKLSREG